MPTDNGASTTMRGSLHWAVRESFLRYVTVVARGTIESEGVVTDGAGGFIFPLRSASQEDDGWHLSFGGWVRMTAHGGFLDVLIAAPEIIVGPSGGILVTHTHDTDTPLLPLVKIDPSEPTVTDDLYSWGPLQSQLLPAAEGHFGNVYEANAEMAPLSITMRHPLDS